MLLAEHFVSEVTRFLVGGQARLVLLKILVLDSNVVQRNDHDGLAAFHLFFALVDL